MNSSYWPGKFTQAIYVMSTGEGSIKERLREALLRIDGLDTRILNSDDQATWRELMKLTGDNSKTLNIRYKTAYKAARLLFQLFEHLNESSDLTG